MNRSAEVVEKITTSLSNLIPQLFFDMIARFLPGLVIIVSFNFVFNDIIGKLNATHNYPYLKYVVFVVACYYASVIFYGLWCAGYSILRKLPDKTKEIIRNNILPQCIESSVSSEDFSLRYDFIKLNAPNAGNRITKLKAEVHMSCELTIAFSFCFVASLFRFDISILFFLLGTTGSFFSYRYFSTCLYRAIYSYSTLIGYERASFTLPDKFKTK